MYGLLKQYWNANVLKQICYKKNDDKEVNHFLHLFQYDRIKRHFFLGYCCKTRLDVQVKIIYQNIVNFKTQINGMRNSIINFYQRNSQVLS
jgi:hypothetical protein